MQLFIIMGSALLRVLQQQGMHRMWASQVACVQRLLVECTLLTWLADASATGSCAAGMVYCGLCGLMGLEVASARCHICRQALCAGLLMLAPIKTTVHHHIKWACSHAA
jgi:hypothetical protein